jgi:hypothetical protein
MAWNREGEWIDHPSDRAPGGWPINPTNYTNPYSVLPPEISLEDLMRSGAPPVHVRRINGNPTVT